MNYTFVDLVPPYSVQFDQSTYTVAENSSLEVCVGITLGQELPDSVMLLIESQDGSAVGMLYSIRT